MLTYNHGPFIEQAIKGVLSQETDFPWEFIIADDCSTDSTSETCLKYAEADDRIKYIRHKTNQGANQNFFQAYQTAKGKFIAFCEGDDYWTDPLKLRKQVDFLEANPDFSICFHDVYELRNDRPQANSIHYDKDVFDIHDLAAGNFMHTPSVMCRAIPVSELPPYFRDLHVGDVVMHMYAAKKGKIKFLPEIMAVYRIHQGSTWSAKSEVFVYEKIAEYLEYLKKDNFSRKVKSILKQRLIAVYANLLLKKKEYRYFFRISRLNPLAAIKITIRQFL